MVSTSELTITNDWLKISESDCTIQEVDLGKGGVFFEVSVGTSNPTESALKIMLVEPLTLSFKEPVWLRLHAKGSSDNNKRITIIK